MAPLGLLFVKTAASFGILCLGIADRSGGSESSAQEPAGDDAGLGGSLLLLGGPGGAGLRRDDRESMAAGGYGVVCVSNPDTLLLQVHVAYRTRQVREKQLRDEGRITQDNFCIGRSEGDRTSKSF